MNTIPHDGIVLAVTGLDPNGLFEQLLDTGLIVDVAALVNPVAPPPPADPLAIIPGSEPDGSFFEFGLGDLPPIPADFFYPGADPFWGGVYSQGEPLNPAMLGDASVEIQRPYAAIERWQPPGTDVEIPIELVSLNLVSCEPITVTYNAGNFVPGVMEPDNPDPSEQELQKMIAETPLGEARLTFFAARETGTSSPDMPAAGLSISCYPNPFNPSTRIEYSVAERSTLTVKVYNVRGELVATLVDEVVDAGTDFAVWDGSDAQGNAVSSGLYLAEIKSRGGSGTAKFLLVK